MTALRLIVDNDLSKFPYTWRRAFAKGRVMLREEFGREARRAGDRDEERRHFQAAAAIRA